jgi:hypothetical protein
VELNDKRTLTGGGFWDCLGEGFGGLSGKAQPDRHSLGLIAIESTRCYSIEKMIRIN